MMCYCLRITYRHPKGRARCNVTNKMRIIQKKHYLERTNRKKCDILNILVVEEHEKYVSISMFTYSYDK